jgi:hypothetical protein
LPGDIYSLPVFVHESLKGVEGRPDGRDIVRNYVLPRNSPLGGARAIRAKSGFTTHIGGAAATWTS